MVVSQSVSQSHSQVVTEVAAGAGVGQQALGQVGELVFVGQAVAGHHVLTLGQQPLQVLAAAAAHRLLHTHPTTHT